VSDQPVYAYYPVFNAFHSRFETQEDPDYLVHRTELLFKEWEDRVQVRGFYSTAGFTGHADLMMWWVASSADDVQGLTVEFARSSLGRLLFQSYAFLGVVRPPETAPDHVPGFLRGEPPRKYLSVYPFVRTPEWYLLSKEERGGLLAEHGEMGRRFPGVLPNTTSAFGLGNWEWILAFEADDLTELVDCIRFLRSSKSRLYVKEETPFVSGIRKPLAEVIRDVV
jgi:peroxiredoxin